MRLGERNLGKEIRGGIWVSRFMGENKRKEKGRTEKHILWWFLVTNIFKLLTTSNFNGWKDQFEPI